MMSICFTWTILFHMWISLFEGQADLFFVLHKSGGWNQELELAQFAVKATVTVWQWTFTWELLWLLTMMAEQWYAANTERHWAELIIKISLQKCNYPLYILWEFPKGLRVEGFHRVQGLGFRYLWFREIREGICQCIIAKLWGWLVLGFRVWGLGFRAA